MFGPSSTFCLGKIIKITKVDTAINRRNVHMKNRSRTLATAIHSSLSASLSSVAFRSAVNAFMCISISSRTKFRWIRTCWAILSSVMDTLLRMWVLPLCGAILVEGCDWIDVDICLRVEGRLLFIRTLLYDVSIGDETPLHLLVPYFWLISVIHIDRANTSKTSCLRNLGTGWLPIWWMWRTKTVARMEVVVIARNVAKYMPIGRRKRNGFTGASIK